MKPILIAALLVTTPVLAADFPMPAAQWTALVNKLRDSGGSLARNCYADEGYCASSIMSKPGPDGSRMMLMVLESARNGSTSRIMCELNQFSDMRTCVNVDTGFVGKSLFDHQTGKWSDVK